jgi:hypothetical protein
VRARVSALVLLACATYAGEAGAVDLPKVGGTAPSLDVTETSIFAQRFEAREGENANDQGYFSWLNRLNALLSWKKFTVGLRLDSSFYELRPEDRDYPTTSEKRNAIVDGTSRYRDAIYPAKAWLTYKANALEATAGDSYVQFGRGLVLSMRKVDELGIDTTLFGGKVTVGTDPFLFTAIVGLANPARVDEPTGRALFLPKPTPGDNRSPQPLFGNDRIVGGQIQLGRGLPVVASTQAVILTKCAPYSYNANGTINQDYFDAPIGTCNSDDVDTWLASLPTAVGPVLSSKQTIAASESLEVPNLWGHGNVYVEAAVQKHDPDSHNKFVDEGNAIYGSFTASGGPVTNTLEMKSYRNYFPLAAGVNVSKASAFGNIAYSAPPTAEVITEDSEFGFFNACVTGGRDRLDYRVTDSALVFGALGYFVTKSEAPGSQCDQFGRSTADNKTFTTNDVVDVNVGTELHFDHDRSTAFINATVRNDERETNAAYYREYAVQYSITKYIAGPYALEISGRHRHRQQDEENVRAGSPDPQPWVEGEHYNTLKVAPKWVFAQGFEYTTFIGLPTYYFNGSVLYKFTSQSNIRALVGQNRGGLRCISGICRFFPAFSGARVELTIRF